MKIPVNNINILWSALIVEELIRHGIDYFCLSPGSRSTPLTTAAARNPGAKKIVIYDERSAAYHALGYARATGKPAALICTSGTAPANYLPAVIEASQENIPLIILSADRPPELRDSGANQTIDQVKLFGNYVRWFFDLPTPTADIAPNFVLERTDRLLHKALSFPPGPVHLNCMFREPLAPENHPLPENYLQSISEWLNSEQPQTKTEPVTRQPELGFLNEIKTALTNTRNGLVVVGGLPPSADKAVIRRCLNNLGWPVLADITSGLRLGHDWQGFVPHLDLLLTDETLHFDTVLHLGDRFVSKRLMLHLQKHKPQRYIRVSGSDQWIDETRSVTRLLPVETDVFCGLLQEVLSDGGASPLGRELRRRSDQLEDWLKQNIDSGTLNQPAVSRIIAEEIPEGHGLFLANSLAVREADMFAQRLTGPVFAAANRGTSGIDGNISTAAGLAAGLHKPVTLLIGDLAFLHDLSALSLLPRLQHPLIIVLINNGGGGIFHWLPVAQFEDIFENYFATPHDFTFEPTARQFGLDYRQPYTSDELRGAYRQALKSASHSLIEIRTDRRANAQLYRTVVQTVHQQFGVKR